MTFFNTLSLFLHRKQWLYRDDDGDDKKKMDTSKKNRKQMATRSESSVDKIEEAFIDYITPKTQTTMENENKCFFSISLENGITITGENQADVLNFLYDAHDAFFKLALGYIKKQFQRTADHAISTMKSIDNAIDTINNHRKEN